MRGHMTTGSQEVMTVDELQFRFAGGGVVGGPLTFRCRCLMNTGAEDVTTIDELQLCFAKVVVGPLTLTFNLQGSYTGRGHPMTTGAQEIMTVDELQLHFVEDSPGGI